MATVLIVSGHPLFGQGVESLLCREAGLVVSSIASDEPDVHTKIAELKPDVVILDSTDSNGDPALLLTHILREKQRAMIISLNLSDNVACVCSVDHEVVNKVSDLLDILRPAVSTVRTAVHAIHV